jgi:ABC-2 type transport system ATP-binding protein
MTDRRISVFVAAAIAALMTTPAAAHTVTQESIQSVPEPGSTTPVTIAFTVFQPDGSSASNPVPVILHSHGWGGSRTTSVGGGVSRYLDAGFGVVSIDQRGHGESGGQAHVEAPEFEGKDIIGVIDFIANLDWVKLDAPGDPVLGSIGGSYGGGYQWIAALTEVRDSDPQRTRLNAIAPDISWNDLPRSLAPSGVVRGAWVTLLYAAGAQMVPNFIHQAFVEGLITGEFPDGSVPGTSDLKSVFYAHSPAGFVRAGHSLNIPVLLSQGIPDNLFNLNEGWHNFEEVLTEDARAKSIFIGHNGGHALPNIFPPGGGGGSPLTSGGGDACSGYILGDATKTRTDLTIEFFKIAFAGGNPRTELGASAYNLTTTDGVCVQRSVLTITQDVPVGPIVAAVAGISPPIQIPIATGPMTLAGIPGLGGKLTALGVDVRAFVGLAIGTNPANALVVQNNLLPIRANDPFPFFGPKPDLTQAISQGFGTELPGVAVTVDAGETLYLTVAAVSDMFVGFHSRIPGLLLIDHAVVGLPVLP